MKNQLLAAIALCCATSSTMPLWAQQYGRPDIVTVTPNLTEDEKGGGVYYIYHVATGKFLAAGNQSGTQLSVDSLGQEITLTYGEERQPLYGREPVVPGEGWVFNMLNGPTNGNRFHEVYMTSESQAFVDCGSEGHTLYTITKNAENDYYRIKVVAQDPTYGAESGSLFYANGAWGVIPGSNGVVIPLLDKTQAGMENGELDWQFVTPEAYAVYQAKNGPLRTALNLAASHSYANVAEYEALYNKADATVEEITEAASELTQAVNGLLGEGATEESPKDFTDLLTNPNFDGGNSGWTDTETSVGLGHQTGTAYADPDDPTLEMSSFCEKWHAAPYSTPANIHQVLVGMPQGRYRLSALTLGYNQANWEETPRGVYLFANDYRAEAWTIKHGGLKNGEVDANDPASPSPRAVTLEFYCTGGDITLGLMTENTNCNWFGFDNVRLEYLGNEGGMAAAALREVTEMEEYAESVANDDICSVAGLNRFEEAVATAKELVSVAGVSDDDLEAALTVLRQERDTLNADLAAYDELKNSIIPDIQELLNNPAYADVTFPQTQAYLETLSLAVDFSAAEFGSLSTAEINGAWERANEIYDAELAEMIAEGAVSNMTGLIQNANFTDNNNGWTFTKNGNGDFKHGNNMSEVWNGRDWEVYQELTDLPQGFYKVTAQAFYSPSSPASDVWKSVYGTEGDEVNVVMASIFGNDASALIHHVADFAQDTNMGNGCEELANMAVAELNGKWTPTNLASAQAIFQADANNYLNSVTCYVGEDGKLRLGMRLAGVTRDQAWVAFDNFQLTYVGAEDQEGAVNALNAKIEQAQSISTADCMVEEAVTGLPNAIAAAQQVVQGEISAELFAETMADLNGSIELVSTANTKFTEIDELVNKYLAAEEDIYDQYQGADAFMEAVFAVDEKLAAAEAGETRYAFATIDEIDQDMNSLQVAYGNLMAAEIDFTATKDEPVDVTAMMQNPSFQEERLDESGVATETVFNYDGWDVAYDRAEVITANDSVFEYYNSENADIHQTIYALKQGYYRVTLNGFYRDGSNEAAALAHRDGTEVIRAYVYAATASGQVSEPLASQPSGVHDVLFHNNDAAVNDTLFNDDLLYHRICNDRLSAKASFNNGYYEVAMSFYVKEGESVNLGVRKDGGVAADWMLIDDFHLYYLGDGDTNRPDDMGTGVEDAVAEGTSEVVATQWFTINGVRVDEPKQRGIYIRQDLMSDGSKKAVKVTVK